MKRCVSCKFAFTFWDDLTKNDRGDLTPNNNVGAQNSCHLGF